MVFATRAICRQSEPVVAVLSILVGGVLDPIIAVAAQRKHSADDEIIPRTSIGDDRTGNEVVARTREHFLRTMRPRFLPEHWDVDRPAAGGDAP